MSKLEVANCSCQSNFEMKASWNNLQRNKCSSTSQIRFWHLNNSRLQAALTTKYEIQIKKGTQKKHRKGRVDYLCCVDIGVHVGTTTTKVPQPCIVAKHWVHNFTWGNGREGLLHGIRVTVSPFCPLGFLVGGRVMGFIDYMIMMIRTAQKPMCHCYCQMSSNCPIIFWAY